MNQANRIKIITIVVVLVGVLAVLAFSRGQAVNEESQVSEEKPEQETVLGDVAKTADNGLLILVNKKYFLDKNYKPDDLEPIQYYAQDRSAEGRFMRAEAAAQFNAMVLDAKEEGYEIVVTTAYRSFSFQSVLYNNYVAKYGQAEADKFSAKPGFSEHQTGLAADISSPSVGYALTEEFDKTPEWKWLAENAQRYGFILRYPKGKTEITGYMYEAWHFRYVGLDVAKIINDENITFEEYIDTLQKN